MSYKIPELVGQDTLLFHGPGTLANNDFPLRKSMYRPNHHLGLYKEALFDSIISYQPDNVVELGVRGGHSTDAILRGLDTIVRGYMYSFDPCGWDHWNKRYPRAHDRWHYVHDTGEHGLEMCGHLITPVDYLYIDTDPHTYEQTKMWLTDHWINYMAPGGIVVLDDVAPQMQEGVRGDERCWDPKHNLGVLQAAIEFIEDNKQNIELAYSVCNAWSTGLMFIKLRGKN